MTGCVVVMCQRPNKLFKLHIYITIQLMLLLLSNFCDIHCAVIARWRFCHRFLSAPENECDKIFQRIRCHSVFLKLQQTREHANYKKCDEFQRTWHCWWCMILLQFLEEKNSIDFAFPAEKSSLWRTFDVLCQSETKAFRFFDKWLDAYSGLKRIHIDWIFGQSTRHQHRRLVQFV